jgi:hypothetical protein
VVAQNNPSKLPQYGNSLYAIFWSTVVAKTRASAHLEHCVHAIVIVVCNGVVALLSGSG